MRLAMVMAHRPARTIALPTAVTDGSIGWVARWSSMAVGCDGPFKGACLSVEASGKVLQSAAERLGAALQACPRRAVKAR